MSRHVRMAAAALLLIAVSASSALAQGATGELRVVVNDAAGLPVATTIELTSESNQFHQRVQTDTSGRVIVERLPDGLYRVAIQHPGFAPSSTLIEIRSSRPRDVRIALTLAPVQMAVTVDDSGTLIDPRQTTMIGRIGADTLQTRITPLPGRSLLDLVSTQPGWVLEANGILHPRGSEYQTQYLIDGVPLTDNRSPAFLPDIDADSVQALRVMTASYPAEYGRKLGGVVDIVTKPAGDSGFHGRASGYGGSDATVGGSTAAGYRSERFAVTAGGEGGRTTRFLDPPVIENYSNNGRTLAVFAGADATLTDRDRIGGLVRGDGARFLVPNERVQQAAGQRQERRNRERAVQLSYQHVFSPRLVGDVRTMWRDISATLTSNAASTPIVASQDRGYTERYVKATMSLQAGTHDVKAGVEADFAAIREGFDGRITDRRRFDPDTPATVQFSERADDREQALFVQDLVTAGNWTAAAGLRWDRYRLLVNESALSPRLGVAYDWTDAALVVRGSYDRVFQTPAFENLLVSSASDTDSLGAVTGLPVRPSRGHFLEAGVTRSLFGTVRVDANVYRRTFTNYADDEVLLNTGISFPVAFHAASIHGFEARIDVPHRGRVSGSFSYSLLKGTAELPITGGLFLASDLPDDDDEGSFPITQDQRHTVSTRWRYQLAPAAWIGAGGTFGSGLPTEFEGSVSEVREAYGPQILERVGFEEGRVRPWFSINASAGVMVRQRDHQSLRIQADVINVLNRVNVVNFAGLFSGTAVGAPRRVVVRLQAEF